MREESPKRILLVGATGYAGRKLAKYLLTSTDVTVILSGRNRSKLGNLHSSLPGVDLSRRTELLELDAANIDVAALPDFELLVNATGTGRHNALMIQACLERGADWIDMQMTNELLNPMVEFEYGFGKLRAYPVEMPELRRLPELLPDLRNTGFFVAGFNWVSDYLVTPLMMLSSNIAPRRTASWLGRLLSWSTKTFARPPYGTVVQVDADGRRDDRPAQFRRSMFHEDAYVLTAFPTVAMIKQMLQDELQPGIHLMGLCCDPVQLLSDIERMGISITQRLETIHSRGT